MQFSDDLSVKGCHFHAIVGKENRVYFSELRRHHGTAAIAGLDAAKQALCGGFPAYAVSSDIANFERDGLITSPNLLCRSIECVSNFRDANRTHNEIKK